jgi:hypothetical protein
MGCGAKFKVGDCIQYDDERELFSKMIYKVEAIEYSAYVVSLCMVGIDCPEYSPASNIRVEWQRFYKKVECAK